ERKRRRLAVGLAAALLALLAGGAAGGLWLQHQRAEAKARAEREQNQREERWNAAWRDAELALAQAATFRRQLRFDDAAMVLVQAQERLGQDDPNNLWGRLERARANNALAWR